MKYHSGKEATNSGLVPSCLVLAMFYCVVEEIVGPPHKLHIRVEEGK